MADVVVPEIPEFVHEVWKKKPFGASDIRWIKNVNDKITNSEYSVPKDPLVRQK